MFLTLLFVFSLFHVNNAAEKLFHGHEQFGVFAESAETEGSKRVLVINIISDTSDELDGAFDNALVFLRDFASPCQTSMICRAFIPSSELLKFTQKHRTHIEKLAMVTNHDVQDYPAPYENRNIGSTDDSLPEHTSEILFSLSTVQSELFSTNQMYPTLSIAFSEHSSPQFHSMKSFAKIYENVFPGADRTVYILDKNKELTSPSDWHDLIVVAALLGSNETRKWLNDIQDIYKSHVDRNAFTLVQPRAAMMETIYSADGSRYVGFFRASDVCTLVEDSKTAKPIDNVLSEHSFCQGMSIHAASIPILCTKNTTDPHKGIKVDHRCQNLHASSSWIHRVPGAPRDMERKTFRELSQLIEKLPENFKIGSQRFRYTNSSKYPLGFCWDTGDNQYERISRSRIFENASYSIPYRMSDVISKSTLKLIMLSSSGEGNHGLDNALHMALGRMYYAHRHGYRYIHLLSGPFVNYLGESFMNKVNEMTGQYPKSVMTKVLMILSQMYENMDMDWLLWLDDDTWFNPGWLWMPLDGYLKDIPPEKLVVLGNHRSAQSNVLFIRNNFQGRRLVRDWLAIVLSGYVQCHGFDQGALEILIVSRLHQSRSQGGEALDAAPYGFTCLNEKWAAESSLPQSFFDKILGQGSPRDKPHKWGCNGGADWSCDFKFETALRAVGFEGNSQGFFQPLSSFSQGCANELFPDFHVVTETLSRPRLHVGFCSRLDEIQGTEFGYDGPLGGGNDYVMRGAINGWLINHKSAMNFYHAYVKKDACMASATFVPACDAAHERRLLEKSERKTRHLISLSDGYAYSFVKKQYCRVSNALLRLQEKETYMKDYSKVITMAKQIPIDEWKRRQDLILLGQYKNISQFKKYFHPANYCASCARQTSSKDEKVVVNCNKK